MLFQQAVDGVNIHSASILRQQQQIASGRRWTRPSEDPTAAAQSIQAREQRASVDRYLSAVDESRDRLAASSSAIQALTGILASARETGTAAANSTLTQSDRDALAQTLDAVLAQVLEVANRQDKYGPIFAGTGVGSPYTLTSGGVHYAGDEGIQMIQIGETISIATNIPGSEIFALQSRTTSAFFGGNTGATPGSGSDSGTDRGSLKVTHGITTFGNGLGSGGQDTVSGIRPGVSSNSKDTIIGPAGSHVLHIDSVAKTIQLNGGPAVAFTGAETDLAVGDGQGGVVYINTTGVGASFTGNVSLAATGTLSTDGGTTTIPIQFTGNQVVVDGGSGATTNVNTTNIRRAGVETVDYKGTSDLFQTLIALRDELVNYSKAPASARDLSIQSRVRELNRNFENATNALAKVGSRVQATDSARSRLGEIRDQVDSLLSNLEDTDFASVVVDYNRSQIALQLAQAAGARLMQTNFLSFLQ